MPSLYKSRDERVQDVMLAYLNVEESKRFSLTHGNRYLPFTDLEKEMMLEDKAWAMARLVIDKIMRLPPPIRASDYPAPRV
ncbi:hypothetical protein [Methylovorus mays]|uniref:hypothetical protein n=1 Tax=Methylovorus mays TaxID=184077 RepID=UPI001E4D2A4F|nr:hypothetical protein [Methylovorus mays]MCB5206271.1 hypothetical protein [Methylovorus mays]